MFAAGAFREPCLPSAVSSPRQNAPSFPLVTHTQTTAKQMNERGGESVLEVCLDTRWHGSAAKYSAHVADLSEAGCYVFVPWETMVGEAVNLKVLMPDGSWQTLEGEVAHRMPRTGFGVRFINLTEDQRIKLRSLLDGRFRDQDMSSTLSVAVVLD